MTAEQMAELAEFIKGVPLFRHLEAAEHKAIAAGMHKVQYKKGDNIFKQGDHGDAFYVIQSGFAGVLVSPAAFIKVNDTVVLATELIFSGKTVPPGTTARVDKYDANRDYPYTIRLQGSQYDGQRGRVMPDEIALKEGNPEAVHVATLKAGTEDFREDVVTIASLIGFGFRCAFQAILQLELLVCFPLALAYIISNADAAVAFSMSVSMVKQISTYNRRLFWRAGVDLWQTSQCHNQGDGGPCLCRDRFQGV